MEGEGSTTIVSPSSVSTDEPLPIVRALLAQAQQAKALVVLDLGQVGYCVSEHRSPIEGSVARVDDDIRDARKVQVAVGQARLRQVNQ
jgi:hypothetical protein